MTREEFQQKSTEILSSLEDVGTVSSLLDELRTGFNDEVTRADAAEQSASELKEKNENLQKANMALYLKTGEVSATGEEAVTKKEPELQFEDLFNDKGELK